MNPSKQIPMKVILAVETFFVSIGFAGLVTAFFAQNADTLRGVAAFVTILAVTPAAITRLIRATKRIYHWYKERRNEKDS
jgi:hypothetical protein